MCEFAFRLTLGFWLFEGLTALGARQTARITSGAREYRAQGRCGD